MEDPPWFGRRKPITRRLPRTRPPSPTTLGFWVGFIAGFPTNLGLAAWLDAPRLLPLGWMLEVWVGCILAAWVVGWVYQEPSSARPEI